MVDDPAPRAGRRERGTLRAQILATTGELLLVHGDPDLVSIEMVVSTVGCTPPALYYYFPTKAALLWEACQLQYAEFAADLDRATPTSEEPLEDLRRRGEAYLAWAHAHPAAYQQLFMTRLDLEDPDGQPDDGALPDFRDVPGLSSLVADLERAAAAGAPIGDPGLTAFALWGLVHGFASLGVTNPEIPPEFLVAGFHRASAGLLLREE